MATSASSMGQLQRAGVQKRLIAGGPGSGPHKAAFAEGKRVGKLHAQKLHGGESDKGLAARAHSHAERTPVSNGKEWKRVKDSYIAGYRSANKDKSLRPAVSSEREARESRIRESFSGVFTEQGQDEKVKKGDQKGVKARVYLVTIIEEGLGNSKDKNYYSAEALQSGPSVFDGAKAFCDHPDAISEKTLPERSMRDVVGWYTDCFTDKNPQTGKVRLRGKLHIFPDAKWLSDKIDMILTDPSAKNLFGISINAIGKTRPAVMDGQEVNYVEEFQRVDSADVVTEPAARGKFDQMLESKRVSARSKVSHGMRSNKRTREAAALSSEKAKEVADSLVSAYNSDNPDEAKEAMFAAAKVLHAASSISGKGPGQSNEEQYSNINPSGGAEDMKQKVKASAGRGFLRPGGFRKKKHMKAAAGTGPDNEDEGEPEPSDIEPQLESRRRSSREADVEDEEERGDLGAQNDFGGGGKHHKIKASRTAVMEDEDEGFEDEGMEDEGMEDEGFEDEGMEDENLGSAPGGAPSMGPSTAAPAGGGMPGSSRGMASEAGDGESDGDDMDDESESDDLDDMDEAMEDEHDLTRPGTIAESRRRRGAREASFSGGLGKHGHSALPKEVDDTKGYTDRDEDWGKEDSSTSGVGKSYKIKTSRFARNRKARNMVKPVVREANRRIEFLTDKLRRLTESNRGKDRKIERYRGKLRMMESGRSATNLLREAVSKEILPRGVASDLYRRLLGMNREEQIAEIKSTARFLESAQEGVVSRLTESVEGSGARGGVASWGTAGAGDSELIEGLAGDGVPMRQEE